jgi:hypothetical protein
MINEYFDLDIQIEIYYGEVEFDLPDPSDDQTGYTPGNRY